MSLVRAMTTVQLPSQPLNHSLSSEYTAGLEIGRQFALQNIGLRYVVTDGDAHSAEGMKAGMSNTACSIERQTDTTHLEQSMFRNMTKTQFSCNVRL